MEDEQEKTHEEMGLELRSLSINVQQKCVDTFVRLNSINVELIGDELEFIRYVIDFFIDYATNGIVDMGKTNHLRTILALMLNISENDERFVAAVEILDKLIDNVAGIEDSDHDEETILQEKNKKLLDESIEDSDHDGETILQAENDKLLDASTISTDEESVADEYFYDRADPEKVHIPPIWTPTNKQANAALIYLYFRDVCFV